MNKWIEKYLKRDYSCVPILTFPAVNLLNCTVKDVVTNSDLQIKAIKEIHDKTLTSGCVSFMDLSVEAEAFGSCVRFDDNEVPVVTGSIVSSIDDVADLRIPEVGEGRTRIFINTIQEVCKSIKDKPVFAGAIGPFSLAGRLNDVSEIMVNCYDDPDLVHAIMKKTTSFITAYIKAFKNVGADGVLLAEPLTGLMSKDMAAEFSEPYVRQIVQEVQDDSFIVIYHNCGNNAFGMIDSILRTGAAAYHFGNAVKMIDVLRSVPSDTVIMGNIDPASQFCNGTEESIARETRKLLEECSSYNNFVISSGCDIPPQTPWKNIDAFFKTVSDFYK